MKLYRLFLSPNGMPWKVQSYDSLEAAREDMDKTYYATGYRARVVVPALHEPQTREDGSVAPDQWHLMRFHSKDGNYLPQPAVLSIPKGVESGIDEVSV